MSAWVHLPLDLGKVTPMTAHDVAHWMASHKRDAAAPPTLLANLNLHALYLRETNADYRRFLSRARRVLIDGWPILVLARSAGSDGLDSRYRVGSTDWLDELLTIDPELKVTAVGGTSATALRTKQAIDERTRSLSWTAVDGFAGARLDANASLKESLESADVVLVGMGMPLQERWIAEHWELLNGAIVANVGGCFDYYAGEQKLAPRWMGRVGLEWAYRLAMNPRRLAKRYLVEPFHLAIAVLRRGVGRPVAGSSGRPNQ